MEQLCGGMIFSHDPPGCAECSDCGDPSRSGMECSALVAKSSGGYHVCTKPLLLDKFQVQMLESLFGDSVCYTTLYMTDELNPFKGVIVRMSSSGKGHNCSLSQSFAIQLELKGQIQWRNWGLVTMPQRYDILLSVQQSYPFMGKVLVGLVPC
ncbi:Leucine-rich repeat and IQ domain-containing protein 3, putative isoform 3 [Hibiscus syriacus]|uniref:Leucine-rich repeat and IQ domain-containing protein 3, putative isoform 3 n=1 Tax=Hibiscus syriacus TaxID=106335 RepID=A0A6A2XHW1_HIBSY|nr:Leucine-rich repeat and IQ domain-containing protein 3, putative isoform 3 [Hibiscus syriacus]